MRKLTGDESTAICIIAFCLTLIIVGKTNSRQNAPVPELQPERVCSVTVVKHEGLKYMVKTSRTEDRQVCLLNDAMNPDGCAHLTCWRSKDE